MRAHYFNQLQKFSIEELETLSHAIKSRKIDSWHILMGNVFQHHLDAGYMAQTKEFILSLFKENRDDQALFALEKEEYEEIFSKIVLTLEAFVEDDPEFLATLSGIYRDARFDLHNPEKSHHYASLAAQKGNPTGMIHLAYQFSWGLGVEKDIPKAFELAQQATEIDFLSGSFCKAFLHYYLMNELQKASEILDEIENFNDISYASAFYTLKAELCFQSQLIEEGLANLQKAVEYDQIQQTYFILGRIYLYGEQNIDPDVDKGVSYFNIAFERGNSDAGLYLGYYYSYNAPEIDLQKGQYYLEKAATHNNLSAKYELAKLYLYHDIFDRAYKEKAFELLERIKNDQLESFVDLAYHFITGEWIEKDLQKACEYLEKAIEIGYGYAAFYLGREYEEGTFNDEVPQYEKALAYYHKGASLEDINSIEKLAMYYRRGIAMDNPDYSKSLQYIEEGIEKFNSDFCRVELAVLYENGWGVPQDYQKAFEQYQAASENYPYAMHYVGIYYRDGIVNNGQEDYQKAFEWFSKAAQFGFGLSEYEIAKAYLYGNGVEQNVDRALELLYQNVENQIWEAAVEIGLHYQNEGDNPELGFQWMMKAVEQGEISYAMYNVGRCYYYGEGTEQNIVLAKKYFEMAVENRYVYANLSLGDLELWEELPESNPENAFEYYQEAAKYDYYNAGLGICYKYGIGVSANEELAFKAFKKAADQDHVLSILHLGKCYLQGIGTPVNPTNAFECFHKILEYEQEAVYEVGRMYMEGEGTTKNLQLGLQYLTQAAENGHKEAQFDIANAYLIGNGTEENEEIALHWFTKAAENGHKEAQRIIRSSGNKY